MRSRILALLPFALLAFGCQNAQAPAATPPPAPVKDATFAAVNAILQKQCAGCHGAQPKEGYDVRTYEAVMKGGAHGPLVKPGDPAGSLLVQVLRAQGKPQMPPSGPLADEEIATIEAWIQGGAKG
jgi:uncharacterized membrane protein